MIRNYRDLTRLEMEQVDKQETIVLIPLGALEQHGNQAPLGTDDIIAEAMVKYIREELEKEEEDFPMLIFPVIPVGLSTEHRNFCGSITFRPDTYYHLLYDISVSLAHHGFKKLAFLVCHGGNSPIVQVLSRELRSELGISPFILSSGAFSHPDVKATVSEGNIWDFHGGEMETSMVMAVDESLVKLDTAEAGIPAPFVNNKTLLPYGSVSIGWVSEDWRTAEGKPIGIGGDPRGATAEKGRIILRTSARALIPGLKEIRDWKG
ncbi:MAG TPA: creatininase family protein [Candidatus Eisenbergiella stercoravium]|nr:creatininase family protein [Candidatus Eisenbergiella stercoravium]